MCTILSDANVTYIFYETEFRIDLRLNTFHCSSRLLKWLLDFQVKSADRGARGRG